jgi:hypothetical protein
MPLGDLVLQNVLHNPVLPDARDAFKHSGFNQNVEIRTATS